MKAEFQKSERSSTTWIQKGVCKCPSQKMFQETLQKYEFFHESLHGWSSGSMKWHESTKKFCQKFQELFCLKFCNFWWPQCKLIIHLNRMFSKGTEWAEGTELNLKLLISRLLYRRIQIDRRLWGFFSRTMLSVYCSEILDYKFCYG